MSRTTAQRDARKLHAYLKRNGPGSRLILSRVDGELWWSDAYVMLPVDTGMAVLLDDYNLTAEPMVCHVAHTIKRAGDATTDFQKLIASSTVSLKKMLAVEPVMLNGHTLLADDGRTIQELWSADQGRSVTHRFDRNRLDLAGRDGEWRCSPDNIGRAPAVRYVDGKVTGLLMPLVGAMRAESLVPEAVAA